MFALNTEEVHCVAFSIGSFNSEGMRSKNPRAGIKETSIGRTVDQRSDGTGYQGGIVIVEALGDGETLLGRTSESKKANMGGCLNKWGIQSKHIISDDGIAEALYSGECRWCGGEAYVLDGRKSDNARYRGGIWRMDPCECGRHIKSKGRVTWIWERGDRDRERKTRKSAGFCPGEGDKTRGIGWSEELSATVIGGRIPAIIEWNA